MPPVAALVFQLLQGFLPGALEWLKENLPMLFAYLKGRHEQRQADKLKTLKTEAKQSTKITERIEEIEKDEMRKIGHHQKDDNTDIYKPDPDKLRGPQPKY